MSSKPGLRLRYFILELFVCQTLFAQVPATAVPQEHGAKPFRSSAPKEVIDWFRSTAIPLKTTSPDGNLEDMSPLRAVIGDARIVAMGEATHGTREFFRMKHRMLEFLAEKMGFTVFAIEANWPESLAVNDYVLNGKGDGLPAFLFIKVRSKQLAARRGEFVTLSWSLRLPIRWTPLSPTRDLHSLQSTSEAYPAKVSFENGWLRLIECAGLGLYTTNCSPLHFWPPSLRALLM